MLPTADVFDCQPLTASARNDLLDIAGRAWKGLVENAIASEVYPIDKIVRNTTTGRCATLRRPRDIVNATEGVVAHSRTRATIEQAADFFYLDTPAKAHQFARVMDELVEAKRALYPLVDRPLTDDMVSNETTSSPLDYISVDWMMIKFKKGVPARDLCYLEIHKEFKFSCRITGVTRRGWVRCIHSVRMDCCPDMQKRFGVIRMEIHRVRWTIVRVTNRASRYYKLYFGSPRGAFLGNYFNGLYLKGAMRTSARSVLNLDEHFTTERLKPLLSAPLDMSLANATSCKTCRVAFTWRNPKKLCRACGDPICPQCSSLWGLTLQGSAIKVPLCKRCVGPGLDFDEADALYLIESKDRKQRYSTASSVLSSIRDTYLSIEMSSCDSNESVVSAHNQEILNSIDQQKELLHLLQERLAAIQPAY
ncbi:hypothetical protein DYB32_009465 [Aphanomyces invadans]|uniref:FYVE zinc finger domain-containing protein n=1 Tax=Aphanomyces invadans TaxID=157072 RepID=A0A3R6VQK4_9STRA|nr:hypothetical protein DYB32_009465 [Aphanomyces invadans]